MSGRLAAAFTRCSPDTQFSQVPARTTYTRTSSKETTNSRKLSSSHSKAYHSWTRACNMTQTRGQVFMNWRLTHTSNWMNSIQARKKTFSSLTIPDPRNSSMTNHRTDKWPPLGRALMTGSCKTTRTSGWPRTQQRWSVSTCMERKVPMNKSSSKLSKNSKIILTNNKQHNNKRNQPKRLNKCKSLRFLSMAATTEMRSTLSISSRET